MDDHAVAEVRVDSVRCEGIGYCTNIAPDLFAMPDDQPPVRLLRALSTEADVAAAQEAEEMCPTRALHVQRLRASPPDT